MAKKYIDADLLRKDIEFAKSVYDNPNRVVHGLADAFRQDGRAAMCDDILKKIDSLQQEQSELPNIAEYYYHKGVYEGLSQGRADALKILEESMKRKADPVIVIKQQKQQDSRSIPVLRADTTEKQDRILEIIGQDEIYCHFSPDFGKETDCGYEDYNDRVYIDGHLTFNKMAEIVDFLSKNSK